MAGITQFQLRARATDSNGLVSNLSPVRTLGADTTSPTVTVDASVDTALADGYLSAGELQWMGSVQDNQMATGFVICVNQPSIRPAYRGKPLSVVALRSPGRYDLAPILVGDGVVTTLRVYGVDAVGNHSSPPLSRTFRVDTVAPLITTTASDRCRLHRPGQRRQRCRNHERSGDRSRWRHA